MRCPGANFAVRQWRRFARRWLARRVPPEPPHITLRRRRLFILPTGVGYTLAVTLLVLLLGSLNYGTSLGFAMTFLLAGAGMLGMLHTYRNLEGITLIFSAGPPVFAGTQARLPMRIEAGERPRWALAVTGTDAPSPDLAPQPDRPSVTHLPLATFRRGRLHPPRLSVSTTWPLALFRVWSWVWPRVEVLVYPAPVDHGYAVPEGGGSGDRGQPQAIGEDEFAGLRAYRAGDPPQRIDWKTLARIDELHVKAFEVEPPGQTWLEWTALAGLPPEARYEQLCSWVIAFRDTGRAFGLSLPDARIPPGRGPEHERRCLEALAVSEPGPA